MGAMEDHVSVCDSAPVVQNQDSGCDSLGLTTIDGGLIIENTSHGFSQRLQDAELTDLDPKNLLKVGAGSQAHQAS